MPSRPSTSRAADSDAPRRALARAQANLEVFFHTALRRRHTDTEAAAITWRRDHSRDVVGPWPRFGFTVTVAIPGHVDVAFEVVMPDLPLDQVNYGEREQDKAWEFPRLEITGSAPPALRPENTRWWWPFGIEHVATTLDAVTAGTQYPNLAVSQLLLLERQYSSANGTGLLFGYNQGLPVDPFAAAWGCRAEVKQSGSVVVLHDRQGSLGDKRAIKRLYAKLNGGLNARWKDRAIALLHDHDMRTNDGAEFTLLDEDGVMVKANTNGSYGYLYVCAYAPRNPRPDEVGP